MIPTHCYCQHCGLVTEIAQLAWRAFEGAHGGDLHVTSEALVHADLLLATDSLPVWERLRLRDARRAARWRLSALVSGAGAAS